MSNEDSLQRFVDAQEKSYAAALSEIRKGRKESHWMWYIFPQIKGLGFSSTAQYYAIKHLEEAREFLSHPVLGKRLVDISSELLKLETSDPHKVMGTPDDLKLKSSMTLFAAVEDTDPVFTKVLDKFFKGSKDQRTLQLIEKG
ncbi:MAG TPA: DUF1810 domain-containing protein [Chitinophagaceae bacterium]|jgi:uncharacterized protein (DUF1810 family)|nr:DUF1810 domain-containing protein [Chitinophagaceae bacterium]